MTLRRGSLHATQDRADAADLAAVEALAGEQMARIDAQAPDNRLATPSTLQRATQALWAVLAKQVPFNGDN